jgi:hypothetical protein
MRTVKLLIPAWTAAIPKHWQLEVCFAPADTEFTNMSGSHLMALKGSFLRGSGPAVEAMFDGMVKYSQAQEVTTSAAPDAVNKERAKVKELQQELAAETAKLSTAEKAE